jgi:formylglycine-generating enzyme required for sulfatase activity
MVMVRLICVLVVSSLVWIACGSSEDKTAKAALSAEGESCVQTTDCKAGLECLELACAPNHQLGGDTNGEKDFAMADVTLDPQDATIPEDIPCEPDCSDSECGDDGCGGSCGACGPFEECAPKGDCVSTLAISWVSIPSGEFEMGCNLEDTDDSCSSSTSDFHVVAVEAFEILETEVTESQFLAVTGTDPSCDHGGGGGSASPVECVTWQQAKAFCEIVDGRLCTEPEWEYAARGGSTTKHYCGNDETCLNDVAWHHGNSGGHKHDVKSGGKLPNEFSLYDMLGNVSEWVEDCWHDTYVGAPAVSTVAWTSSCHLGLTTKVVRAGSAGCDIGYQAVYRRDPISYANPFIGFRCCRWSPDCTPDCTNQECGGGGCLGHPKACGSCGLGEVCQEGTCGADVQGLWTDPASGLMWLNPPEGVLVLAEAVQYCLDLDKGGHTDWRYPAIGDLRTLIRDCPATEAGGSCPVVDGQCTTSDCNDFACDSCPGGEGSGSHGFYWPKDFIIVGIPVEISQTSVEDLPGFMWGVNFLNGGITTVPDATISGLFFRCVR